MRYLLIVLFLVAIDVCGYAQAPNVQWQKSLGGSGTDEAYSIQQTKDGGYIVAGASQSLDSEVTGHHGSATNFDYWVVKLDDTGAIQWETSLGGTLDDIGSSVQQTSDSGYIVVGYAESRNGDVSACGSFEYGYWVVKLSPSGVIEWKNCFGGMAGSAVNEAFYISQTLDSNFIVAGYTNSGNGGEIAGYHGANDYLVVKISATGGFLWSACLGGSSSDMGKCVQPTRDSGYIVAGYSESTNGQVTGNHGSYDYWVVKLDAAGSLQWEKSLGGSRNDEGKFVRQTLDGGYIVAGASNSNDSQVTGNHGGYDMWVVKLDDTGAIQWEKSLGGYGDDWASSVEQTSDSGYIIAGYSDSSSGQVTGGHGTSNDYWIVKLSKAGNLQWQKSLGGSGPDNAYSIQQTTDSGYIVAGGSSSTDGDVTGNNGAYDYWVVKLSACLLASPVIVLTDSVLSTSLPYASYKWEKNGVPVAGATNATYTLTSNGTYTVFVQDTNACMAWSVPLAVEVGVRTIFRDSVITVIPNPTTDIVNITGGGLVNINVYNITGQRIKEAKNTDAISIAEFPEGMYFIWLSDEQGNTIYKGKIVKE